MRVLFIFAILVNILLSSESTIDYFIAMINTLQIVVHIPILRILMPGNLSYFFNLLIPFVMFDILDGLEGHPRDPNNLFEFDDDLNLWPFTYSEFFSSACCF
jgi:hypothetical protein